MSPALDAWCREALDALDSHDLRRALTVTGSAPAPTVEIDGESFLLMCSNNYLGLATDPRLEAAAVDGVRKWGAGTGASRLVSGTTQLHRRLEARLAALKGCEDAVLFSSGYLANVGTIGALVGHGDAVVSDALNHASLVDGCRLSGATIRVHAHADAAACEAEVRAARAEGGRARRVLIVTDSVFSMDGDAAPLAGLVRVAREHDAWLMADEAHATGVLGRGRGAIAAAGLEGEVDIVMGTCSKALGSAGGFVAGSRALCEYLRNRARTFVFDTAPPAATVAATLAAVGIVEDEPWRGERVRALAGRLAEGIRKLGYDVWKPAAAVVPVVVGSASEALEVGRRIRDAGVFAPPIRPPSVPQGTARIRLCPMATHTEEQIEQVVAAFG